MNVFVAGATGAIGTRLVRQLAAAGHEVTGMTRSPARTDALRALGARPGTGVSADPETLVTEAIRRRRLPIVGDGDGIRSYVRIDDTAGATVAAIDNGGPGIYNVVGDDPAPVREWLPFLADQPGGKKPVRVRGDA